MSTATFWAGKRVLVTGNSGFKGSWLSLWLNKLGAEVHGYALAPTTKNSLYQLASLDELVDSRFADVRDAHELQRCVNDVKPDIVFHLAAQPLVRESIREPAHTVETNVMGTVNVLNAVRHCSTTKAVVVVTSDKCYQNNEWHWGYREDEPLGGHDPYSASKACAELIVQSWRLTYMSDAGADSHACAVASARAGNVIGGGDWSADRLIPDILACVSQSKDVVLRNPNAVRPWQHVLEPLAGYLLLAEKLFNNGPVYAQAWNFGPHDTDAKPVSWIADRLIKALGSGSRCNYATNTQFHEAQSLKLDCSKAQNVLGWSPVWTLSECIEDIARWHSAYMNKQDMRAVSMVSIGLFEESALTV